MNCSDIITNLSSTDLQQQSEGIKQIKNISLNFDVSKEYICIHLIQNLLELGSNKNHQMEVEVLCDEFVKIINPYAFESVFQEISNVFSTVKYQSKILGLRMVCNYAKLYPQVIASNLHLVIDALINLSSDIKKEVKTAVQECWVAICDTIENVDIKPIISFMIDGYMNPSTKTEMALEKLASTPFVNDIDIPTLSLLIPILVRAMREKKVVCQRKAAVVMDTLCKLIKNPVYARIFYDKLTWILDKGINEIAIEEVRNVCTRSKNTLNKIYEQSNTKLVDAITKESCLNLYKEELSNFFEIQAGQYENLLDHTISLVLNLVKYEIRDIQIYFQCIEPYLKNIVTDKENRSTVVNSIATKLIDTITVYEYDPEENEDNLCDCMFSLAYGTRVLLHQTPLKLKLNHTYGILGHNGAGKSTLLRAMSNKTLQGFPDIEATYIEHHIPEELHELITLDYIASNPKIKAKGITREEIIRNLSELYVTEHMMNSPLSTLSGGNVQRVNLILAKLAADPLILMDEPTNHIDALSIIWLKNYIKNTPNTTFLIISHDIYG